MATCPSTDELIGLLDNGKPDGVRSSLFEHVERCSMCRERLRHLVDATAQDDNASIVTPIVHVKGRSPANDTRTLPATISALPMMSALPEVPGFEIVAEVGRGGMGVVYMARQTKLNRTTALKMVLLGPTADPTTLVRFLFEAEVLARIQHPNVVQIYEVGTYRSYAGTAIPFLAMEYLDGGTLHSFIRKVGLFEPRAAAQLIEGLARAVHAVHSQGVIHRDLKPANILRSDDGTFKVSDFGLAKLTTGGSSELTATGTIVGTPAYMSPEQATGSRTIGPATDVYSLGAILYELLAGQPPYPGQDQVSVLLRIVQYDPPNVRSLRPKMPIDLSAITMRALAREPARRYASAEAMADDLRRFLDDRPTVARPATVLERFGLWVRRNPAIAALLMGLGLVTFLGLGLVLAQWSRAEATAVREERAKDDARAALAIAEAQRRAAQQSEAEKNSALEKEKLSVRAAGRREARLVFYDGMGWCEKGEPERGFASFHECIHLAQLHGDGDLERVARANRKAWDAESIPRSKTIPNTQGAQSVAYSADGTLLAIGSAARVIQVHDAESGRVLAVCEPSLNHMFDRGTSWFCTFWTVAFNADKTLLAAGASDGRVWLWKLPALRAATKPIRVLTVDAWNEGKSDDVWGVAFDRAGHLDTACGDGVIRRWDVSMPANRKLLDEFAPDPDRTKPTSEVQALIVTGDGRAIYSGDRVGRVREWNVAAKTSRIVARCNSWVQDLALSPDGSLLAATIADGTTRILNLAKPDRPQVAEFATDGSQGNTLDFSADGRYLVVGSGEGNARVWDVGTAMTVGFPIRDGGDTRKIRFRPGTDTFAVATGGAVEVFKLPTKLPRMVAIPKTQRDSLIGGIASLAFSPDGNRLLAVHGNEPFLVEVERNVVQAGAAKDLGIVDAVAFGSNRERETILALADRRVVVLDSRLQRISTEATPVIEEAKNIKFAYEPRSDSTVVASDRSASSYRIGEAKPARMIIAKGIERITALAINPANPEVLIAIGRKIHLFNTATGILDPASREAEDDVFAAAYSPDGTRVLLGVRNNAAEVRDKATWKSLYALSHHGAVVAVGWRRDGSVMVTGSRDKTVGIWDAKTGLPLGPRLRHPDPLTAIAYSPTDDVLATACKSRRSATAHVLLWPIPASAAP